MQDWSITLAYLTAGISISIGSICFFLGIQKREKADLLFGLMGLCLAVFLLLPPSGFIVNDHPPYEVDLLIKRIFIFSYYGLFPWFIRAYTGKKDRLIPAILTCMGMACYTTMFFTVQDRGVAIWSMMVIPTFGSIALYGIASGIWLYRRGEKVEAKWFLLAITIYASLMTVSALNKLTNGLVQQLVGMQIFFPLHFHALLFLLIMGLRTVADAFQKYELEKLVKSRDKRWQSFMYHAPVFVLELDKHGRITYINDFGLEQLGHRNDSELLTRNWFDTFSAPASVKSSKLLFDKVIREKTIIPYLQNTIFSMQGKEIQVDWINYLTYSDDGQVLGVMSVGRDVTAGISSQRIINQLRLELEKENVTQQNTPGTPEIIGSSKAIAYAIQKAHQVAATNAPVLLDGETGVGKELFADLIHKLSSRNGVPMVKVNCGALPKELIEDELFGHEKGAFTSAIQSRKGRFELADGGTIFLDEIGELPLEMQPKLLRVLQNGEFEKVGGQKTIKVNVRVIAATNRDLAHEISENRFRDDLFYRLNVFPITIPAIRKRKEDLPELINHFISHKSKAYNKSLDQISKADLQRLMDYPWPGNVRELENVIERSVIASPGSILKLDWFLEEPDSAERASTETLEHIERTHIIKVMEACSWKINGENGAAEKLSMHPNTLRSRMKKLGINRPAERPASEW